MKKNYCNPICKIVTLQSSIVILAGTTGAVKSVESGDANIGFGGSSENNTTGQVRSRQGDVWGEEGQE